jgi:hypothetical protein
MSYLSPSYFKNEQQTLMKLRWQESIVYRKIGTAVATLPCSLRLWLQLKLSASRRVVKVEACDRHIHIVVAVLTVGNTGAIRFIAEGTGGSHH